MGLRLQYATKRIAELEDLLLVDVPDTVWPAEVKMVFLRLKTLRRSRHISSAALSITSTACGWRKCRYRQLLQRPVRWHARWGNTRERNHCR